MGVLVTCDTSNLSVDSGFLCSVLPNLCPEGMGQMTMMTDDRQRDLSIIVRTIQTMRYYRVGGGWHCDRCPSPPPQWCSGRVPFTSSSMCL